MTTTQPVPTISLRYYSMDAGAMLAKSDFIKDNSYWWGGGAFVGNHDPEGLGGPNWWELTDLVNHFTWSVINPNTLPSLPEATVYSLADYQSNNENYRCILK